MKKCFISSLVLVLVAILMIEPVNASAAEVSGESGFTIQGGTDTPYNFGVVDLNTGFDLTFKGHLESVGNNATLNVEFTNVDSSDYSFKLTIWQNNASDRDVPTDLFIKSNSEEVGYDETGWLSYLVGGSTYSYRVAYDKEQTLMIEKFDGSLSPIANGVNELNTLLASAPSTRYFIGFSSNVSGLCFSVKTLNGKAFKANTALYSELLEQYSLVYDLSFYPNKLEYSRLDSTMQSYYLNELRNEINYLETSNEYQKGYDQGRIDGYNEAIANNGNNVEQVPDDENEKNEVFEFFEKLFAPDVLKYVFIAIIVLAFLKFIFRKIL